MKTTKKEIIEAKLDNIIHNIKYRIRYIQEPEQFEGIKIAQLLAEGEHAISTNICLQDILEKLTK